MNRGFSWENLKERDHLEGLCVDGIIILKWILGKYGVRTKSRSTWFRVLFDGQLL
jgi:hypothetical protein